MMNNMGLGFVFTARDLASSKMMSLERRFMSLDRTVGLGTDRLTSAFAALGVGLAVFTAGAALVGGALSPRQRLGAVRAGTGRSRGRHAGHDARARDAEGSRDQRGHRDAVLAGRGRGRSPVPCNGRADWYASHQDTHPCTRPRCGVSRAARRRPVGRGHPVHAGADGCDLGGGEEERGGVDIEPTVVLSPARDPM